MELSRSSIRGAPDKEINLSSMCRMCGTKVDQPISIFGPEGLQHELPLKIQTYLPIKVLETDLLPLHLCYECTNMLIQWDATHISVVATDRRLKAIQWRQQQIVSCQKGSPLQEKSSSSRGAVDAVKSNQISNTTAPKTVDGESLCCSVCNRSGMDFRQLMAHLKNHDSGSPQKKVNKSTKSLARSIEDPETSAAAAHTSKPTDRIDIQQPVVRLERVDDKMTLRSRKKPSSDSERSFDSVLNESSGTADKKQENKDRPRLRKRIVRSPVVSPSTVEQRSQISIGDPQVTSSTGTPPASGPSAALIPEGGLPGAASVANDHSSSVEGAQRPKVRIISAENINLTLEQRQKAKADQTPLGQSLLTEQLISKATSPAEGSTGDKAGTSDVKRIPLPANMQTKLLRLADGRIIRLIDRSKLMNTFPSRSVQMTAGRSLLCSTSQRVSVPPNQSGLYAVPQSSTAGPPPQTPVAESSNGGGVKVLSNATHKQPPLLPSPSPSPSASASTSTINPAEPPQTMVVKVEPSDIMPLMEEDLPCEPISLQPHGSVPPPGNISRPMRLISFQPQPGPKTSLQRFSCMFCGRRNLLQGSLQDHAQTHKPKKPQNGSAVLPTHSGN